MSLTSVGRDSIVNIITNGSATKYGSNSYLAVGNASTSSAASQILTQTALQGASVTYLPMDAGYPTINGSVMTFRATALTSQCNYSWYEFGIFNASSSGTMLCRTVDTTLGSVAKTSAQVVQFTVTVSMSA